jgi:di/tricarboxylate transporter
MNKIVWFLIGIALIVIAGVETSEKQIGWAILTLLAAGLSIAQGLHEKD